MQALHSAGVVHGDIALRNIFICDRTPIFIDLDQARVTSDRNEHQTELEELDRLQRWYTA